MSRIDLSQEETNERTVKYYDEFLERQEKVGVYERHKSIAKKPRSRELKTNHEVLEIGRYIGTFTSLIIPFISNGQITAVDIGTKKFIELQKESKYQVFNPILETKSFIQKLKERARYAIKKNKRK